MRADLPLVVRRMARDMRKELIQHRYQVILVPAPKPTHAGHMVRTCVEQNPDWYRRLCASWTYAMKLRSGGTRERTRFARKRVIRSLARIAANKMRPPPQSIDDRVLPFVLAEVKAEQDEQPPF